MRAVIWGLLIPFIGTSAGAACVFFLKKDFSAGVQRALNGFAAGVMVAASIWTIDIWMQRRPTPSANVVFKRHANEER